jgi:hypothetical protein
MCSTIANVLREQREDVRCRGSQGLPDSDLVGAPLDDVCSKPEQPERGDQHGQRGGHVDQRPHAPLRPVVGVKRALHELMVERGGRCDLRPRFGLDAEARERGLGRQEVKLKMRRSRGAGGSTGTVFPRNDCVMPIRKIRSACSWNRS